MKWLNELIGMGLSALGLDITGRIGGSIQFFFYDVIKITVLLCFLILLISYIPVSYTHLPQEYDEVVDYAISIGVENGFVQEGGTAKESFIPPFDKEGL